MAAIVAERTGTMDLGFNVTERVSGLRTAGITASCRALDGAGSGVFRHGYRTWQSPLLVLRSYELPPYLWMSANRPRHRRM